MNACQQTQALLFEKADGRAGPAARAALDAHLGTCPHCRQVFAAWESALPRLRGLAPDEVSAVSLRRMENEVLRQLPVAAPPRARVARWLALAAGLIAAVGVGGGLLALRAPRQPFARIQAMWGDVTLSGVAMTRGAAMENGAVLTIAAAGEATFLVGRGAEVRLFGPGQVAFEGSLQSPRLRLASGRLAVQIASRRADETFAVATAHGRVEVRGTRFIVGYGAAGSYVHVEEGEVVAFRDGVAAPFAVRTGQTFSFESETAPEPPPAEVPSAPATPDPCPKSTCIEAAARARRAMRAGHPARAVEVVDQALGRAADCAPGPRCLDELGYLRAEGLRQAGRLEAAVAAYQALNRPGGPRAMRQNALYAAAQLEQRLGRRAEARTSLEQAYAANPDGALAEEALAALLELGAPGTAEARAAAERYLGRYPQGMAAARARRILSGAPGAR